MGPICQVPWDFELCAWGLLGDPPRQLVYLRVNITHVRWGGASCRLEYMPAVTVPTIQEPEFPIWGRATWEEIPEDNREFGKIELETIEPTLPQKPSLQMTEGSPFFWSLPIDSYLVAQEGSGRTGVVLAHHSDSSVGPISLFLFSAPPHREVLALR